MADLVSFETLINNLNTELNALAVTLKAANKISRAIPFNIVEHYQDSEAEKDWSATVEVDGLARRVGGGFSPSQTYQSYSDRIIIAFDSFTNDAYDMDYILNQYAQLNSGKLVKTDDWVYSGTFDRPQFVDRTVDKGEQRIVVFFEVLYTFVLKGITADDILLKINAVEVPVLSYTSKVEKRGIVTNTIIDPNVEKGLFTSSSISKTIKFIHINDTQINLILEDIDTGNFLNRTYTIFYGVSCDENGLNCLYDSTVTAVLSNGSIDYAEGGFQTIEATFLIYNDL
jgi:hypothetical protein